MCAQPILQPISIMKLPAFEYACPTNLSEAVALLAGRNVDAKLLAGGQSLMPMLAFRLAAQALLVDLRKVPDLRKIDISTNGIALGSMVRWCDILADERLRSAHPLLVAAVLVWRRAPFVIVALGAAGTAALLRLVA